ncbi:MAG: hypothetical protein FRX48_01316 [Lasallia pustulata]|uniref:Uncharacterized protein n=1 Tax=Lasallia pustulata TaxID=136370 RepID=A0A5M8PYN4_9LECA|nr:MAG: hypothetical protein FRX48_01316 [Lasallia pustulata]
MGLTDRRERCVTTRTCLLVSTSSIRLKPEDATSPKRLTDVSAAMYLQRCVLLDRWSAVLRAMNVHGDPQVARLICLNPRFCMFRRFAARNTTDLLSSLGARE